MGKGVLNPLQTGLWLPFLISSTPYSSLKCCLQGNPPWKIIIMVFSGLFLRSLDISLQRNGTDCRFCDKVHVGQFCVCCLKMVLHLVKKPFNKFKKPFKLFQETQKISAGPEIWVNHDWTLQSSVCWRQLGKEPVPVAGSVVQTCWTVCRLEHAKLPPRSVEVQRQDIKQRIFSLRTCLPDTRCSLILLISFIHLHTHIL